MSDGDVYCFIMYLPTYSKLMGPSAKGVPTKIEHPLYALDQNAWEQTKYFAVNMQN